jgi:hypothetical protein
MRVSLALVFLRVLNIMIGNPWMILDLLCRNSLLKVHIEHPI